MLGKKCRVRWKCVRVGEKGRRERGLTGAWAIIEGRMITRSRESCMEIWRVIGGREDERARVRKRDSSTQSWQAVGGKES